MKKILGFLFCLFVHTAYADDIANVKYVHELLEHQYGVFVPYADDLADDTVAANMLYLLTVVDIANGFISGTMTNYAASEYATDDAADVVVTKQAYDTLLKEVVQIDHEYPFELSVNASSFSFSMSAQGEFYVDWGDGNSETIIKENTQNVTYSHAYSGATGYSVRIGGLATDYNDDVTTATISFENNASVTTILGNLSMIFPTLENGKNPRFYNTFANMSGLTGAIPASLFIDLTGAPVVNMFYGTFKGTTGLRGAIPGQLFGELTGAPADGMFFETFRGLSQLTAQIPVGLFSGITGTPATDMFRGTFYGCSKLRGNIPAGLFAGISGQVAPGMFSQTFYGCTKLAGIDDGVFGNLTGDAQTDMFTGMFYGDNKLYGYSPKINGQYLYEIWPSATQAQVGDAFYKCQKLSDYSSIPSVWR